MSSVAIFIVGAFVFSLTIFGAVMAGSVALTRRFYEQNDRYTDRPGSENAGIGLNKRENSSAPGDRSD